MALRLSSAPTGRLLRNTVLTVAGLFASPQIAQAGPGDCDPNELGKPGLNLKDSRMRENLVQQIRIGIVKGDVDLTVDPNDADKGIQTYCDDVCEDTCMDEKVTVESSPYVNQTVEEVCKKACDGVGPNDFPDLIPNKDDEGVCTEPEGLAWGRVMTVNNTHFLGNYNKDTCTWESEEVCLPMNVTTGNLGQPAHELDGKKVCINSMPDDNGICVDPQQLGGEGRTPDSKNPAGSPSGKEEPKNPAGSPSGKEEPKNEHDSIEKLPDDQRKFIDAAIQALNGTGSSCEDSKENLLNFRDIVCLILGGVASVTLIKVSNYLISPGPVKYRTRRENDRF